MGEREHRETRTPEVGEKPKVGGGGETQKREGQREQEQRKAEVGQKRPEVADTKYRYYHGFFGGGWALYCSTA